MYEGPHPVLLENNDLRGRVVQQRVALCVLNVRGGLPWELKIPLEAYSSSLSLEAYSSSLSPSGTPLE